MDCSTPDFPVLHCIPEFAQNHVHWTSDAIQPSHPLSPPSPPALSLSQHQGLFQWVRSSQHVAKALELQHQHQQADSHPLIPAGKSKKLRISKDGMCFWTPSSSKIVEKTHVVSVYCFEGPLTMEVSLMIPWLGIFSFSSHVAWFSFNSPLT